MTTVQIHINEIQVGDKVLRYGDLIAVITGTQITGKGYQRIFGYHEGEENNPHLLEDCNCHLDKVIENA